MASSGRSRPRSGSGSGRTPKRTTGQKTGQKAGQKPQSKAGQKPGQRKGAPQAAAKRTPVQQQAPATEEPRIFRLGAVPGATPGKWIDTWKERMPHVPLELAPISAHDQRAALDGLDAAIVRLPLVDDALHVIPLYEETVVVVASVDSHLMAADELTAADLDGEVLLTADDDVLGPLDLPTVPAKAGPLPTTADAIATAATGIGVVVVPMSLARLHHRKDIDHRPLQGAPTSPVGIAWHRDRATDDVETFIGIVRGRTARSSR